MRASPPPLANMAEKVKFHNVLKDPESHSDVNLEKLAGAMPHIAPVILKRRGGFSGTSKRPPLWYLGPETATGSRNHSGALTQVAVQKRGAQMPRDGLRGPLVALLSLLSATFPAQNRVF